MPLKIIIKAKQIYQVTFNMNKIILAHFTSIFIFYTLWNRQKQRFRYVSKGIEMGHWRQMR